ncbi:hypothetical protein EVAR_30581_1 [Eumeta japonica]|uniref:Uncharacterized protein n=1 Tax=Eumeta variegata TaxID=151549 RepID=A0A4C1VQ31_EUMVA|nr:hypothetical protein EVAR_30581_1 [Eumeta japonica]
MFPEQKYPKYRPVVRYQIALVSGSRIALKVAAGRAPPGRAGRRSSGFSALAAAHTIQGHAAHRHGHDVSTEEPDGNYTSHHGKAPGSIVATAESAYGFLIETKSLAPPLGEDFLSRRVPVFIIGRTSAALCPRTTSVGGLRYKLNQNLKQKQCVG